MRACVVCICRRAEKRVSRFVSRRMSSTVGSREPAFNVQLISIGNYDKFGCFLKRRKLYCDGALSSDISGTICKIKFERVKKIRRTELLCLPATRGCSTRNMSWNDL